MAPDRRDAQPAQAVQIQAIPAAGAVTGERMRGSGPGGDGHQGRIARHQREANANQRGASVRLSNRVCPVGRELYPRQTPSDRIFSDQRHSGHPHRGLHSHRIDVVGLP